MMEFYDDDLWCTRSKKQHDCILYTRSEGLIEAKVTNDIQGYEYNRRESGVAP